MVVRVESIIRRLQALRDYIHRLRQEHLLVKAKRISDALLAREL